MQYCLRRVRVKLLLENHNLKRGRKFPSVSKRRVEAHPTRMISLSRQGLSLQEHNDILYTINKCLFQNEYWKTPTEVIFIRNFVPSRLYIFAQRKTKEAFERKVQAVDISRIIEKTSRKCDFKHWSKELCTQD